ncbi:MAG: substrate-binding domain-containing protein [Deltaproteobacteria bacterium]|nr:substrate-binding domain-containing protein [Deltaproteobacteria bacterium]
MIRTSVEAFAKTHDCNLQFVVGRELDSPLFHDQVQNGIFEQIDPVLTDGIIILTGALSNYCGPGRISQFCNHYRPASICSVGIAVPEVPSVLIRNPSFGELVEHLITVHEKKHIAFLGGPRSNTEAQQRREVFLETLRAHHLLFDLRLEACGEFLVHKGFEATMQLLSKNVPMDAIVAANDDMAIGALTALQQEGIRIPEDIAVTGFDDLCESRFVSPRLTTMRQPFETIGDKAASLLWRQMDGETVPLITEVSPRLVLRRSCGCRPPALRPGNRNATHKEPATIETQKMQLEAVLLTQIKLAGKAYEGWASRLVDALFQELEGEKNAFTSGLREILSSCIPGPWLIDELHTAISYLRSQLQIKPEQAETVEDMWHRGRILLFDSMARLHIDERLALIRTNKILVMRSLDSTRPELSRNLLLKEIIHELLTVGVRNAVISVFTNESCQQLESVVAIREGRPVADSQQTYPSTQLIPDFMRSNERNSYVYFSLASGEERLGILALDGGNAGSYYEMLSEYLSANIKLITLYQDQQRKFRFEARERQRALELQHRQKLESLGVLAGGVAHDFNNMLSVMAGNLDIIHMEMPEEDTMREPLQECRNTVKRATGLVQQLLAYSGKSKFSVARTNLNAVIQDLEDFLKMAVSKNVRLKFQLTHELPDVEADTAQLNQIFVNLVINASEAIEELGREGLIRVETTTTLLDEDYFKRTISQEILQSGEYVVARIIDNGTGIDKDTLSQIFDPFYTTKFGGRGLGLAAVLGIVRGHRGSILVDSQLGKGTTFELAFPLLPTQDDSPRKPVSRPTQIGAGTILIVDDEKAVLKAGARLLQKMGFSTLEAQNGQQAIHLVQDFPDVINCILMDITMPGIGGIAAMSEIRKIDAKIPVVLTSGYSEESAEQEDYKVKPAAFLQKPYNLESLAGIIYDVMHLQESNIHN